MNRRKFIHTAAASAATVGLTQSNTLQADHHNEAKSPKLLEWRHWQIESASNRAIVDRFLKNAAIPALNKNGIKPVGVFYPQAKDGEQDHSIYALVPHQSLESYYNIRRELSGDGSFLENGQEYLSTPKGSPAYTRIESTLMRPFDGYPDVKTPRTGERIFELRVYESHNEMKAALKVEMFNSGEFDIFDRVGLDSVFCGEALSGPGLPNLTYLVAYKNMEERKEAWARFSKDPQWQVLRKNERFADTVSKIHQTFLNPAPYSQI
ncbi:MAG: NIPSNAP family protein [Verrucomicrobia bacterium]|nr:NIPSNAP family protein [Verrucomicrobiota bacterium]